MCIKIWDYLKNEPIISIDDFNKIMNNFIHEIDINNDSYVSIDEIYTAIKTLKKRLKNVR
jgi:Ca2+-binding EF-hand superfamily protein